MRRDRSVSVFASIAGFVGVAAIALTGCTATECAPDEASRTVTVRTAKPGIAAVQCWSGCAPDVRDLEPVASDEWTALLSDDRPESVTLAARDADGGLLFGQRFHVEWSGCPAGPNPDVLELFRPEGGSQPDSSG
jgi:hypothetical protein